MTESSISTWFRGIKGKLLFAAVLPLIGFAIAFVISSYGTRQLSGIITTAHDTLLPNYDAIGGMRVYRLSFTWKAVTAMERPEDYDKNVTDAEEFLTAYKKSYQEYTENPFIEGEDAIHDSAKSDIQAVVAMMEEILAQLKAKDPSKKEALADLIKVKLPKISDQMVQKFTNKVFELYKKKAEAEKQHAKDTSNNIFTMLILTIFSAALVIFGILLAIASKVSNSVGAISGRLAESSNQVAVAVEQLNAAGNTLSSSSTEAAASLEETVASLEEMTSMVKMGSDNAKQAAALATASCDSAATGAQEIQNLIKSMNEISASSKKIEEIISVIDDIAFQTNLLALNAAVEAARAGEQGKGFAVVAEAVRALAQRSAASAKDISGLIKDSVSQIDNGSEIADRSGTILSNILGSIKKVSDLNNEIAAASQEQATGIEQINKAMSQLDQSGQANAASAEEIAATSGEISNLATTTQSLTVNLNAIVLGQSAGALPFKDASGF